MHENICLNVRTALNRSNWTHGKSFKFQKNGYILKFITIEFDSGASGSVDVRILNDKGSLVPWEAGGTDNFIRCINDNPHKFLLNCRVDINENFIIEYINRSSVYEHDINVYFEFVRGYGNE